MQQITHPAGQASLTVTKRQAKPAQIPGRRRTGQQVRRTFVDCNCRAGVGRHRSSVGLTGRTVFDELRCDDLDRTRVGSGCRDGDLEAFVAVVHSVRWDPAVSSLYSIREVMMGMHLSATLLEHLDRVQAEIDRHVAAGPDGRCLGCSREQPCPPLRRAAATLLRYGRLPARRPGLASRGVRGRGGFGWFGGTDAVEQFRHDEREMVDAPVERP
jgi:hypothetical protein